MFLASLSLFWLGSNVWISYSELRSGKFRSLSRFSVGSSYSFLRLVRLSSNYPSYPSLDEWWSMSRYLLEAMIWLTIWSLPFLRFMLKKALSYRMKVITSTKSVSSESAFLAFCRARSSSRLLRWGQQHFFMPLSLPNLLNEVTVDFGVPLSASLKSSCLFPLER